MELPSMVQRSGDTLIVRSVVSGNQLYFDANESAERLNGRKLSSNFHLTESMAQLKSINKDYRNHYKEQEEEAEQQQHNQKQMSDASQSAVMDLKDEALPQCKIKRNYSCNYCTYFTQNPRYHLTHLRDVHGEKIVINKCKLCLYASRHYQKLVRHMRMVHGCTDSVLGAHGQPRKRGMNRETRKRKLEQTSDGNNASNATPLKILNIRDKISLEQVKNEFERQTQQIQRDIEAFRNQYQREQQQQQQHNSNENILDESYKQMRVCPDFGSENARSVKHPNAYQQTQDQPTASSDVGICNYIPAHSQSLKQNQRSSIHLQTTTPTSQQLSMPHKINFEMTPTPSKAMASNSPVNYNTTENGNKNEIQAQGVPLEASGNNRLLKCSLCDYTTLYKSQLDDHEAEDHCDAKFYRCEKCSYVTHIKARYSKHIKYHSMPMIKCVTCDFRTPYKWNLDRHMKNHGGTGAFKCTTCDFTADIKQSLTVHEMNHHVPTAENASGVNFLHNRNKIASADMNEDAFSDTAELLDQYNNNNVEDYEDLLMEENPDNYCKNGNQYEEDRPTDLSQKGGGGGSSISDSSSVGNHSQVGSCSGSGSVLSKQKKPLPNLIPIAAGDDSILNLSKTLAASRNSLNEIASIFFNEKQISEMLLPMNKSDASIADAVSQLSSSSTVHSNTSLRSLINRKSGGFFEKLKSSSTINDNLVCPCGHMAKYLSESIIHRKNCKNSAVNGQNYINLDEEEQEDDTEGRLEIDFAEESEDLDKQSITHSALNLSVSGSTRCQQCRHRCKSSTDLKNHLRNCPETVATRSGAEHINATSSNLQSNASLSAQTRHEDSSNDVQTSNENRVFIWNKLPTIEHNNLNKSISEHMKIGINSINQVGRMLNINNDENSYYGVETAPGYGEVTKKMTPEEEANNSSLKKVYKCPHCSFWASTASRFHVHIVGHLNKKPFECSLCSYRSNWRWDITKHIRLKTIRDPSHKNARVLMNDETGRRNYTKYNKYITLMKVTEEDGDPKLMKSGEMTPNQVASLSFINDYNNKHHHQKQQQHGSTSPISISKLFNGKLLNSEDITLEPIPAKGSSNNASRDEADNLMRLPLLASMMTAAMAQQQHLNRLHQHEQHKIQENATLITPSVTISAVKRETSPKTYNHQQEALSDDIQTETRLEGDELKIFYKCLKCNFRHSSRNITAAHAKTHYLQPSLSHNFPLDILSAAAANLEINNLPLNADVSKSREIASKANAYMNKVIAMCLNQRRTSNSMSEVSDLNANDNIRIQQADNTALMNGLVLALAGKSSHTKMGEDSFPVNSNADGEQATSTIKEASSITTNKKNNKQIADEVTISDTQSRTETYEQLLTATAAKDDDCCVRTSPSLQHLLTCPKRCLASNSKDAASISSTAADTHPTLSSINNLSSQSSSAALNITKGYNGDDGIGGGGGGGSGSDNCIVITDNENDVVNADTNVGSRLASSSCSSASSANAHKAFNSSHEMNAMQTTSSASITNIKSDNNNNNNNDDDSNCNKIIKSQRNFFQNTGVGPTTLTNQTNEHHGNNNNNGNGIHNGNGNCNANGNGNNSNGNGHNTTSHNKNSNKISVSHSGDRRDPSPYRCGHCHQVSNWKHVIQRHCRLKHSGDICIEMLDRCMLGDSNNTNYEPIYKPLINGIVSNEINNNHFNLAMKSLQQQQQQKLLPSNNIVESLLNLNCKNDAIVNNILQSTSSTAVGGGVVNHTSSTPQELQAVAAVAYLTAAYKAAAAAQAENSTTKALVNLPDSSERLQQQTDSKDVVQLSSSNCMLDTSIFQATNAAATGVICSSSSSSNNKSKQQRCPLCTYICDSKSQMNYHISLHKPTQYECKLCTFICAKKQHLSSHLRAVHQINSTQQLSVNNNIINYVVNLDPKASTTNANSNDVAVMQQRMKKAHQDALAIDLSAIRCNSNSQNETAAETLQQQQSKAADLLRHENENRLILYCQKCPARYIHTTNEPSSARRDLEEHQRGHSATVYKFHCKYCDFKAAHENLMQNHAHVHTTQYQDKLNELMQNCQEDKIFKAPKLICLVVNTKPNVPENIWIVDKMMNCDMNVQQNQLTLTSSSYEGENSLLKKQLESRTNISQSQQYNTSTEECNDNNNDNASPQQNSTSASIPDNNKNPSQTLLIPPAKDVVNNADERCPYCPFQSTNSSEFKTHLQHHVCISQKSLMFACEHCDYTTDENTDLFEHIKVHFNSYEQLKDVKFFTAYDKLELSTEQKKIFNNSPSTDTENDASINIKTELSEATNDSSSNALQSENGIEGSEGEISSNSKCTKVILYKSDSSLMHNNTNECLATSANNSDTSPQHNVNISDRLRRRLVRQSQSQTDSSTNPNPNSPSTSPTITNNNKNTTTTAATTFNCNDEGNNSTKNHKTVLVNHKTGQVIGQD